MDVVAAELTGVEKDIKILMLKRDVDEILELRYVAGLLLYRFGLLPFVLNRFPKGRLPIYAAYICAVNIYAIIREIFSTVRVLR